MSIETARRLARHAAATRYADFGEATLAKVRTFLLDSIGVGIAGSSGAGVRALIDTVGKWGSGDEATVWSTGERMSAQGAAIVNAYQLHCLEFDCVHEEAVVHPMATVLSAMMAHAERRSAAGRPVSGQDFIAALVVGVDIATLLGVAATGPVRFFRPSTAGGLGATAALVRMEGGDEKLALDAMGVMYGQTSGTLQPHAEGSPVLGLQIGFNARAAVTALDLAMAGFAGPHDIVDGQYGYLPMFEAGAYDLSPFDRLGREWQIERLSHKPLPSGRLTHGVVDALKRATEALSVGAGEIARVEGRVPPLVHRLVSRPDRPQPAANYAKLCLAYVAGAYMVRGRVGIEEFREPALSDRAIHAEAAKVFLTLDGNPDENALDPQHFTITLKDGRSHAVNLKRVFGHPEAPLDDDENLAKFRACVAAGTAPLDEAAAARIIDAVAHVDGMSDVAALARLTVAGSANDA